jgi:hypothetical protein
MIMLMSKRVPQCRVKPYFRHKDRADGNKEYPTYSVVMTIGVAFLVESKSAVVSQPLLMD